MPDLGTTVDPFVVTGVRGGAGGGFGGAVGGLGALLGGALGGAFNAQPTLADYYRGNPGALSDAISRMFPQDPQPLANTQASSQPAAQTSAATEVSPVDVVGHPGGSGAGAGIGTLAAGAGLAGLGALSAGGSSAPGASQTVASSTDPSSLPATDVSPVTVMPTVAPTGTLSPLTMAALTAGVGGLAAGQLVNTGTPDGSLPNTPVNSDDPSTWTPLETAIAAGGLGGLAAGQIPSTATPNGNVPQTGNTGGTGGTIPPFVKDLLPLVPLLAGGTGGGVGDATNSLKKIADNNIDLSNRLGGIANAGFAGDIGGRGLNSIARMVRNAQAAIRQRYASMNMSGSTAEQDDLNAASQAGVDQQFKIGQQMAQTGLAAIAALTGQSASIYTSLLNAATAKDTALGNALSKFAAAVTY